MVAASGGSICEKSKVRLPVRGGGNRTGSERDGRCLHAGRAEFLRSRRYRLEATVAGWRALVEDAASLDPPERMHGAEGSGGRLRRLQAGEEAKMSAARAGHAGKEAL